jgi:hypothetical protein
MLLIIPNIGIFKLAQDFFETLFFQVVVKDTPGAARRARVGLLDAGHKD